MTLTTTPVKNRSNQGSYMTNDTGFYETNISTLFVDAMYKHKGFSLMAEYASRDAADPYAKNSDGSLTGARSSGRKWIKCTIGLFTIKNSRAFYTLYKHCFKQIDYWKRFRESIHLRFV